MKEFKRKLYRRGSSYETTIPMPMLFAIDPSKKQDVLFKYDSQTNRWYVELQQASDEKKGRGEKR